MDNLDYNSVTISGPKQVAEITICGCINLSIYDSCDFIKPTDEQIKNLHDMLCIDVKIIE